MARRVIDLLLIGCAIAIFMSGCTNSPTGPQQSTPTLPSVVFKGPKTNSSDPNVQAVNSAVAAMNAFSNQLAVLTSSSAIQQGTTRTWTSSLNTLTITLTATVQADGSNRWAMLLRGTDSSGTTYSGFAVARGTTSSDGKSGTWDVYDTTSTSPISELIWSTTNSILTGSLRSFTGGSLDAQAVIVDNPDNSGQMTIYSGTFPTFRAVWQPNGSGTWWTYDPNGALTATGNWT